MSITFLYNTFTFLPLLVFTHFFMLMDLLLSNSYTFLIFPHFSFQKSSCLYLLTLTFLLHFNIVCISYVCCSSSSIPSFLDLLFPTLFWHLHKASSPLNFSFSSFIFLFQPHFSTFTSQFSQHQYSPRFPFRFIFFLILLRCALYYPPSFINSTSFQAYSSSSSSSSSSSQKTSYIPIFNYSSIFSSQLYLFFSSSSCSYSFPYHLFLPFLYPPCIPSIFSL